jgi:DNA-binding NarL/FixJ family response regulator
MSLGKKTILLIDDHALIRDGIRSAISTLGFESIFEAATRSEAFAQMAHKNPDVIVVDLNLPDGHGLEIVQWARKHSETIAIVILSLNADTQMIKAAGAAGASAYISKSAPISELVAAIEIALKSPLYFLAPTGTANQSLDSFALSPREIQILVAMDTSARYSEMARLHFISEATLKSHISSIFTKMGVNSRIAALVKAKQNGLL